MKKKIIALSAALMMALAFGTMTAQSAAAYTSDGNVVYNMGQDSDVSVQLGNGNWLDYARTGQSVYPALCVIPHVYMKSQWGGGYAAGQKRCFTTANNTLKLYRI